MKKTADHILKAFTGVLIALLLHEGSRCDAQVPSLFRQDTLSICFIGDVMMHSAQIADAHRGEGRYDFSPYFVLLEERIREADIAVANLEFTLAGEPHTGYPEFSAPDTLAAHLALTGFDVFLAANNHIYDKGSAGAARTAKVYRRLEDKYGIRFTGLAESLEAREENTPLTIRRKGISIALINFTYGTNLGISTPWPRTTYEGERSFLEDAFERAEENGADFTIALPHWGEEYMLRHSERQEKTARWLIRQGADIIIGTHPHVIQDSGMISDKPVAYSLGNAISNMSADNTQMGLMATVRIVRHWNGDLSLLPLEFTYLWCSRPGGFGTSYMVIPVKEYIGKRDLWNGTWDYDKMMETYVSLLEETGIKDGTSLE